MARATTVLMDKWDLGRVATVAALASAARDLDVSTADLADLVARTAGGGISKDAAIAGAGLSRREVVVLQLIGMGLSNQDVADREFLSVNTVKSVIRSAYRKIGVRSRSQSVRWVLTHDLGDRAAPPPDDDLP